MTPLRRKRLLMLATGTAWHKAFYSHYHQLIQEGLVRWTIGSASLTKEGLEELNRLRDNSDEKTGK
jgi:hypothetical protein